MKSIEMNLAEMKNFATPDEVREFPLGRLELVRIGGATVGRGTFQPGWHWAKSVQPIAKTASCEAPHFQYQVSGVMRVRMDDGTEFDCKAGDVAMRDHLQSVPAGSGREHDRVRQLEGADPDFEIGDHFASQFRSRTSKTGPCWQASL